MKDIALPRIVSIGIYNAQIAIKNRTVSKNRKTTMFEIELPIGSGGTSYIDNDAHPISENVVICAKPGQTRHTRLPFECYYIHIIVGEGALFDILAALPNYMDFVDTASIKEIFTSLCEHWNTGIESDDLLLQSLILKLIYILNKNATHAIKLTSKRNHHQVISKTLEYINNNLSDKFTLEKLADLSNFNKTYFHKVFKASTGKTLHDYIEDQRIKKSINLLISTDMTLTEIAYECGFSSQSYFSYAFKRRTGLTPRDYAKNIFEKYEE